jgi:sporulation protein YlmC with PRC-barrel domain
MKFRTSTALAVVLALAPASAFAAAEWNFSDVDADGNLELSEREFENVSRAAFDDWDQNLDQRVSGNELYRGVFLAWDSDRDSELTDTEYREGYNAWFGDDVQPEFEAIAGEDNVIGEEEFASGLRDTDALADFEIGDEGLDRQAFGNALFNLYDADDDGNVVEEEYSDFGDTRLTAAAGDMQANDPVAPAASAATDDSAAIQAEEVVALPDWQMENYYTEGLSVEHMTNDMEVYGPTGEEIGSIENVVFARDGNVLSLVAEVGGFWDMFDTHVNVPWDEVEYVEGRFAIPVTEENVDDYDLVKTSYLTVEQAESEIEALDENLTTGPRAFRADELIGDYVRIRNGENRRQYGYVRDLIVQDGRLQAVVVNPSTGYGVAGPYAYPYYGYGWNPGGIYYDMPYEQEEVIAADRVEYERFGYN